VLPPVGDNGVRITWPRRILIGILSVVLLCVAAMSLDDARFWWRYADRVPGMIGLAAPATANAVPSLRAVIKGQAGVPLRRCTPPAAEQAALDRADGWAMAHKSSAFLVWQDGCVVHEHYADGDAATSRPAGAMAKSLMALVAGRAIREGYLHGLDEPVADQLPEWRADGRRAIRYRDMLSMHAGLAWYHQTASPFGDFQRIILASDYAPRILQLPRVATPGTLYDYSAWTYDLLGIALARAGRRPYEQLASDLLAKPLGLGDERIYVDRPGGTVHGNCCLFTRADDWVRLGALLIDESRAPRLLPAGFVEQMQKALPDQPHYGLGVWLGSPYAPRRVMASPHNPYPTPVNSVVKQSEPFLAPDVMVFEGVAQNKVWVIPSRRLVIVRLGKEPGDWDDAALPNMVMKGL
jgi:CubicO group peptidase (beta-lactamase class C family)